MLRRLTLLMLLLTGCVSTRATPLGTLVSRQAVSADQVVLYRTPEQVPGRYAEVALLTPGADPTVNRWSMASLRKKAGALGANAVILLPSSGATSTKTQLGYDGALHTSSDARFRAVAIFIER